MPEPVIHTDDELLAMAAEWGWEWVEGITDRWPGSPDWPFTGWITGTGSAKHDKPENKMAYVAEHFQGHNDRCTECGRPISYRWLNADTLRQHQECYHCNSWLERIRAIAAGHALRPVGRPASVSFVAPSNFGRDNDAPAFYSIGHATRPSSHNGFGGSWFTVSFIDGRQVETCDLWFGSVVPERFRDRLPVTATVRGGRLACPTT